MGAGHGFAARRLGCCLAAAAALAACAGPNRQVQRVEAGTQTDYSGKWNDQDARATAEAMIQQALDAPWLGRFETAQGRVPAVRVRRIVNKSDEHIDSQIFVKDIERALIGSGRVRVLAQEGAELKSVEAEQVRGASGIVSDETAPALGQEVGADFVVAVRLSSITDQIEGQRAKFYKINFEMIDPTTGEKVWIGDHEIKKVISQDAVAW